MTLPTCIFALVSCYARDLECFHVLSPYYGSSVVKEKLCCDVTLKNGVLHCFGDEPFYHNPHVLRWIYDGKQLEDYIENKDPNEMTWWKDGVLHRDNDMPAYVSVSSYMYRPCRTEEWYQDGVRHRDKDAAVIRYRIEWTGWESIIDAEFYKYGKRIIVSQSDMKNSEEPTVGTYILPLSMIVIGVVMAFLKNR